MQILPVESRSAHSICRSRNIGTASGSALILFINKGTTVAPTGITPLYSLMRMLSTAALM